MPGDVYIRRPKSHPRHQSPSPYKHLSMNILVLLALVPLASAAPSQCPPAPPCGANTQFCSTGIDPISKCNVGTCMAMKDPRNCPLSCPCKNGETTCPAPVQTDLSLCPIAPTCLKPIISSRGKSCAAQCPVTCPEGQVLCPGDSDSNACKLADTCVPAGTKCPKMTYDGNGCPVMTAAKPCPAGKVPCPSEKDANNCPTESWCADDAGKCA